MKVRGLLVELVAFDLDDDLVAIDRRRRHADSAERPRAARSRSDDLDLPDRAEIQPDGVGAVLVLRHRPASACGLHQVERALLERIGVIGDRTGAEDVRNLLKNHVALSVGGQEAHPNRHALRVEQTHAELNVVGDRSHRHVRRGAVRSRSVPGVWAGVVERQAKYLRLGRADNAEEVELLDGAIRLVEVDAAGRAEVHREGLGREG